MPAVFSQEFGQVEGLEVWIAAEALCATSTCQQWALTVRSHGAVRGRLGQEFLSLQLETEEKKSTMNELNKFTLIPNEYCLSVY